MHWHHGLTTSGKLLQWIEQDMWIPRLDYAVIPVFNSKSSSCARNMCVHVYSLNDKSFLGQSTKVKLCTLVVFNISVTKIYNS